MNVGYIELEVLTRPPTVQTLRLVVNGQGCSDVSANGKARHVINQNARCSATFSTLPDGMVTFLFIRHAESKDNISGIWAGFKDSPLSNHGVRVSERPRCGKVIHIAYIQQAEALAKDLARLKLSAIHSSDLRRAKTTARFIKDKQANTSIPHTESANLREQNFGAGEGMKIAKKEKGLSIAAHVAQGLFPVIYRRQERFPGGESLDDMAGRAEGVIDDILLPHLLQEREDGVPMTVAIVSHGLFIAELVAVIVKRDRTYQTEVDIRNLRGMKNTGWTRLDVQLTATTQQSQPAPPSQYRSPPLLVQLTGVNKHTHLSNLHRQKGGIGNLAYDPKQLDIRAFLGKENPARDSRAKPY